MDFLKWLFTSAVVAISGVFGIHQTVPIVVPTTTDNTVVTQQTINDTPSGNSNPVPTTQHATNVAAKPVVTEPNTSYESFMQIRNQKIPVVVKIPTPTNTISAGQESLFRFSVSATKAGDISIGRISFEITSTSTVVSSLTLNVFSDDAFTMKDSQYVDGIQVSPLLTQEKTSLDCKDQLGRSAIYCIERMAFNHPLVIRAGQKKYFELVGTVATVQASASIKTRLLGDAGPTGVSSGVKNGKYNGAAYALNALTGDYFDWSPQIHGVPSPADQEWINGYVIDWRSYTGNYTNVLLAPGTVAELSGTCKPVKATVKIGEDLTWKAIPSAPGQYSYYFKNFAGGKGGSSDTFSFSSSGFTPGTTEQVSVQIVEVLPSGRGGKSVSIDCDPISITN